MHGKLPVFKLSEVSLVDIELLIDIGKRFDLKEDLTEGEQFEDLERYLKDGKDARAEMKVQTFASNINELLAESFFLKGGFAGEFASEVINDLVQYLLDKQSKRLWNMKSADQLIELVGDDVVKMQLRRLFVQKYGKDSLGYKAWLKKEYERLGLNQKN